MILLLMEEDLWFLEQVLKSTAFVGVKYPKYMSPNIQKLKQKLAYEFRIIGLQKSPTET